MSTAILSTPPLRHGERLDPDEFLSRYENMPDVKAELLDGVVYIMSSPISFDHDDPASDLSGWLFNYRKATPGVAGPSEMTVRLPGGSIPQPDAYLRILDSHGGRTYRNDKGYLTGSPELVGEVSVSSLEYDRGLKLDIYRRNGVREFILWNVSEQQIEWNVLRNEEYELLLAGSDGLIRSEAFPGLWLAPQALVHHDLTTVFHFLDQGLASPEHAQFVAELERRRLAKS